MIGLCVAKCFTDMAQGRIDVRNVEKIIGATAVTGSEGWESLIEKYRATHWKESPDAAEMIFRDFLAEGKIFQPRLTERRFPNIVDGIWAPSEDKIAYVPVFTL